MSDTPSEQGTPDVNLGFTTRTDVGGQTGTEGAVRETNQSAVPPAEVAPSGDVVATQTETSTSKATTEPGKSLGTDAPKLADLQGQLCPNCHTGVVYVTRYDPESKHEADQGTALQSGHESGGAYDVLCASCGFSESRAFNPGKLFGR